MDDSSRVDMPRKERLIASGGAWVHPKFDAASLEGGYSCAAAGE